MEFSQTSKQVSHLKGGHGIRRAFYLPRLPREFYQGDAVVHWTLPMAMRARGWLNPMFHTRFREILLHTAAREALFCPVYCLMPDHIHLMWMGLQKHSDQRKGMKFLREYVGPFLRPARFQHSAYDHVLKEHERERNAFAAVCHYILRNPFRAGLVSDGGIWSFQGAMLAGYPSLQPNDGDYWPTFWNLYTKGRAVNAGDIGKPIFQHPV